MCGDTPSSRRTFDAYASGCVPVLVGTRLWGRCDPPCKPGWGWRVSGVAFPHLPFHGLWLDWSRFPLLDELALVSGDADGAVALMRRALGPVAAAAGGDLTEGLARVRAYQLATRYTDTGPDAQSCLSFYFPLLMWFVRCTFISSFL